MIHYFLTSALTTQEAQEFHLNDIFVGLIRPVFSVEAQGWITPDMGYHDPYEDLRVIEVQVADLVTEAPPIVVTTAELKMLMMPEYEKIIAARESNPTVYALFDILLDPSLKPFPLNSKFLVDSLHRLVEQEFISSDRVEMILAGVMQ
jgi:hypothetical protein